MKILVFDKISFDWTIERSAFPFELCREARACPVRARVGLEVTDVRDRLGFIDGTKT
jgi:hypothetical protein